VASPGALFAEILGGAPLVVPLSDRDLENEELRPLIDRLYRGSTGDRHDRVDLFKLIWGAVGSEFGSRHEWYEINHSGNQELMHLDMAKFSGGRRPHRRVRGAGRARHVGVRPRRLEGGHLARRPGPISAQGRRARPAG
jgi:hypothetical protein